MKPVKEPVRNPVAKYAHEFNRCKRIEPKHKRAQQGRKLKHKARNEGFGSFERKGLVTDEKSVLC